MTPIEKKIKNRERTWHRRGIPATFLFSDFVNLLECAGYQCRICCKTLNFSASVDHCHKTGKVRDVLCNFCNKEIVLVADRHYKRIKRAIEYVDQHRQMPTL